MLQAAFARKLDLDFGPMNRMEGDIRKCGASVI